MIRLRKETFGKNCMQIFQVVCSGMFHIFIVQNKNRIIDNPNSSLRFV